MSDVVKNILFCLELETAEKYTSKMFLKMSNQFNLIFYILELIFSQMSFPSTSTDTKLVTQKPRKASEALTTFMICISALMEKLWERTATVFCLMSRFTTWLWVERKFMTFIQDLLTILILFVLTDSILRIIKNYKIQLENG